MLIWVLLRNKIKVLLCLILIYDIISIVKYQII